MQTFVLPGGLALGILLYPALNLLKVATATPTERAAAAKQKKASRRTGGRGPGGLFGPPGRGGGLRGPGGLDPESFGKSKVSCQFFVYRFKFHFAKAKVDLTPVTNTKFADVAGCDSAKIELEEVVDFLKSPDR